MAGLRFLFGLGALGSLATAQASYNLQDHYNTTNFFEGFEFFSGADPTNGFVKYQTALAANSKSLAGYANNGIYLGVDHTTTNPAGGRASVRLSSKKTYTKGLFLADIAHMPGGAEQCGVWPAFWTFGLGQEWPANGEIDIIEGVNSANTSTNTLHTSDGCKFAPVGQMLDCHAGNGNTGCGVKSDDTLTYGDGFNAMGGGVWAMEWTSEAINIYFFTRASIPADITSGQPNPASWKPVATFSGGSCNIEEHFKEHTIVFNTALCGDWAGKQAVWAADPVCSKRAPTCQQFVAENPNAFATSYWIINSVKIFSAGGASGTGGSNGTAYPTYKAKRGVQPTFFKA